MTPTAYPSRPLTNSDILWGISFINVWGRCKPNGMKGLNWVVYWVFASSREEALSVLRKSGGVDWEVRCCGLLALRNGEDIRICEFDLARRQVTQFDPSGLDPNAHHHHAIVLEWPAEGEVQFPGRGEAALAREQVSRAQDAEFLKSACSNRCDIDDLPEAAKSLIQKRRGCWNWQGAVSWNGYGRVYHAGQVWSVHRLTYTLLRGDIPDGAILRHLCHNASCCNPNHLMPGTHLANKMDEKVKKDVRKLFRTPGLSEDARLLALRALYGLESMLSSSHDSTLSP